MQILRTALIVFLVVYALFVLLAAIRTKKPFKTIAFSVLLGLLCLAVINLTSRFSGVGLPINLWTVSVSAAAGIPGVIMLLILQIIF